jgi:hypothetical protein
MKNNFGKMTESITTIIDFDMGRLYLGKDHELFLKRFVEIDLQVYLNKIQDIFIQKDYEELVRCCDSLSSTSAYIGAKTCEEISKNISNLVKINDSDRIKAEISNLIEHSEKLESALKEFFYNKSSVSSDGPVLTLSSGLDDSIHDNPSFRLKVSPTNLNAIQYNDMEDDIDPYEEINKEWKCFLS